MAAFLPLLRPRTTTLLGSVPGKLLLSRSGQTGSRVLAGCPLFSPYPVQGWRSTSCLPFSSWTKEGVRTWGYHRSYQRPELAKWGDWACLGLTVLAGGLFWTSNTSREGALLRGRLVDLVVLYGALRYSIKRKLLRLRLKWLRHKLVLRGVILQEFERENEACLDEVDSIMQGLEDAIFYKMENDTKKGSIQTGDPFLISAMALLRRIEKLRVILSRKPERSNGSFPHMNFDPNQTEWFEEQLSRLEGLVRQLVKSHAVTEARIVRNRELIAKVDELLLSLEQEK